MSDAAVAVIRSSAILHNFARLRRAAAGCKIMAVIKANAYGHGLEHVARLLQEADALAVARIDEGVRLRAAGITQPVVVLEGCANLAAARLALEHELEIVVHDPAHFRVLAEVPGAGVLKVWLKIDTGMGRLGFAPARFAASLRRLRELPAVRADIGLMTHLACADDADNPLTMEQLRRLGDAAGRYEGDVSIANSAAVLLWPQTLESSLNMDYTGSNWVRPGLALFGASPVPGKSARDLDLRPAMSFESRLISVKTIKRGMTVGYGAEWRAARETVVGVAAVGYGDGYPRQLPSGTPVLVNGRRVALIGRVSMDMINVDLTDVPVAAVGDTVTLWGGHLPIEEIATRAGTIPYELMCGLGERVVHVYLDGDTEGEDPAQQAAADIS